MNVNVSNSFVETTDIVIVGAGIAGLGAALTLEKSNFKDYIVLEAQSYVGGRIHSVPWNDGWLELGAQFLHGRGSALAQLAERKGLLSDVGGAEGQGIYIREDGTRLDRDLVLEVDDVVKDILEDCEKYATSDDIDCVTKEENVGEVLRNRFQKYLRMSSDSDEVRKAKEELFDWNVRFLVIDNACSRLDELSVKGWGKFKAVSGPEHNNFDSHYSSIVESIASELTQDNLRLNNPVSKIEWNESIDSKVSKPVLITLQSGAKILAKCAIITCSLGFLKENLDRLFSPPLPPRLRQGIESMGYGPITKIFLDFDEAWWEPRTKGFQFLWREEKNILENTSTNYSIAPWTRDLTGFDVLNNHDAVLLGWVGRRGAHVIETLSDDQIIKDCAELFRFFLKDDSIPEASQCLKSSWTNNEYVRGGYSHITKECDKHGISPATLGEPVWGKMLSNEETKSLPVLMLAGEATHESFYSTTHGAYDSGVKQARIFLQYYAQ